MVFVFRHPCCHVSQRAISEDQLLIAKTNDLALRYVIQRTQDSKLKQVFSSNSSCDLLVFGLL